MITAKTFCPKTKFQMTMQKRPQTLIYNSLSSSELIILRSIALGLGCDTIRDLLELSEKAYRKECESLFQKLEVCNAYGITTFIK